MILRRDRLGTNPAASRSLTGSAVAVFDPLVADRNPAFHLARRRRPDRPDRRRAFGGGDDFDPEPTDQLLRALVWLRHDPTQEALGYRFGVSDSSALRAIRRCLPVREPAGEGTTRRPDPGRGRRNPPPALLHDTPAVAVPVDTFEPRVQRPQRRQRAYYSGKKKCHTVEGQVAVDEESGRIGDIAASVPGPRADLQRPEQSRLLHRLPPRVGAVGDLAYVGILACTRTAWRRRRAGSPAAGPGRRRTGGSTGHSRGGGSGWSTGSGGGAGSGRGARWIGTTGRGTPPGCGRSPGGAIGCWIVVPRLDRPRHRGACYAALSLKKV